MIEFMVIALPRSGTTWTSNWLTTGSTLCLHDPLWKYHYSELDSLKSTRELGISCTGSMMFPEWLNNHPARKVILHRDVAEVNASLNRIGLPVLPEGTEKRLDVIDGMHVDWREVFDKPKEIYEFLLQRAFDGERHNEIKHILMEPNFNTVPIDTRVMARLNNELRSN
jgi:hypothetical protein